MTSNTANGVLSVSNPTYEASAVGLPLKVVVNRDDAKYDSDETAGETMVYKTLELAHYFAEGSAAAANHSAITAGLNTAYWDPNHTFLTYSTSAHADKVVTGVSREKFALYATYNVTVKIDTTMDGWNDGVYTDSNGGQWTAAQIATELANKPISVTLAQNSSRAMFFSLGSAAVESAAAGAASPSAFNTTLPASIPNDGTESSAIAKFGLYVEGTGATDDIDANNASVSGNFTVTVAGR